MSSLPLVRVTLGPMLLVSGGFYDGKSAIVEPLTHSCMMLRDDSFNREEYLARQLLALKHGDRDSQTVSAILLAVTSVYILTDEFFTV